MSSSAPNISVVIPTYNRANLVRSAISSVQAQTYRDFEIVVVDDGSTDDTARVVEGLGPNIRYFFQQNRGASAAQNKGIELARGRWVAVLASDDTWSPEKLELQMQTLAAFDARSRACVTDCVFTGNPDFSQSAFQAAGLASLPTTGVFDQTLSIILGRNPALFVQSLMVEKSILDELGAFDPQLKIAEDTDLFFRLSFRTQISYINRPLVQIDSKPQSKDKLSRAFLSDHEFLFRNQAYLLQRWLAYIGAESDGSVRGEIQSRLQINYYRQLRFRIKSGRFGAAMESFRELRKLGATRRSICKSVLSLKGP